MLSAVIAVCMVATSKSDVQVPARPSESTGREPFSCRGDSCVLPYDFTDDVSSPPLSTNCTGTRWTGSAKGLAKSGYLRMKPKHRASHRVPPADIYSNEYRIKRAILTRYDHNTIPVRKDDIPIPLYVGMSLYHILDTVITPHFQIHMSNVCAILSARRLLSLSFIGNSVNVTEFLLVTLQCIGLFRTPGIRFDLASTFRLYDIKHDVCSLVLVISAKAP